MQLARYLDKLFQKDGFLLIDANSNKYIIGTPKNKNPIIVKILDKKLHYKLLLRPDLYFGEGYSNGSIVIENGSLTDFLDIALMNLGRNEFNFFSKLTKKYPSINGDNISLHIRRGDYVNQTNFHPIQSIEYYKKALDILGDYDNIVKSRLN